MRHRYYYDSPDTSFTDATIHKRQQCESVDHYARPLASTTVEGMDSVDWCPDCAGDEIEDGEKTMAERDIEQLIEMGTCPWCHDEFDSVGRHASAAHADEWEAYRDR